METIKKIVKVPLYLAGFILLAFAFAFLTFKLMSFSRTVEVPDLSGKTPLEANELLSKRGLNLKIEGEDYDLSIPSGNILRQDAPAGSRVKEHRSIRVILSKGPLAHSVPSVAGKTLDEAELLFLQNGLKVSRVIRVSSDSIERNKVIAQRPQSDEKIGDRVILIVSSGPYDVIYYTPDFQGMTIGDASELAEKLGLIVKFSGSGKTIKSQKPGPGSQIKRGDAVNLQLEEDKEN